MAYLYRKPRTRRDPDTGRRVPVVDGAGRTVYLPRWRIEYRDWQGRRVDVPGALDRAETARLAARLEADHGDVRAGLRPLPDAADDLTFAGAIAAYLAWGRAAGGRRNRPWDVEHAAKRASRLAWWLDAIGDLPLADLAGQDVMDVARARLARLEKDGRAGKTVAHYREALVAFGAWAKDDGRFPANPFIALPVPDTTRRRVRRDPALAEVHALLAGCPLHRRMLYELAFGSGFRAGELRAPGLDDLGVDHVRLPAWADKAGKERHQPLWPDLAARLRAYAETGDARRRYEVSYRRRGRPVPDDIPARPLVYVPVHPSRTLAADARAAGVAVRTLAGVFDFHAARVAYINLALDAGADVRDAQALARHASPKMTVGVYGRSKERRRAKIAAKIGRRVAGAPGADLSPVRGATTTGDNPRQNATNSDTLPPEHCRNQENGPSDGGLFAHLPAPSQPLAPPEDAATGEPAAPEASVSMVGGYKPPTITSPSASPATAKKNVAPKKYPEPVDDLNPPPPTAPTSVDADALADLVYQLAYTLFPNERALDAVAQDAVQEAFLEVWDAVRRPHVRDPLAYARTILRRVIVRRLQSVRRCFDRHVPLPEWPEEGPAAPTTPAAIRSAVAEELEDAEWRRALINGLPRVSSTSTPPNPPPLPSASSYGPPCASTRVELATLDDREAALRRLAAEVDP